MDVKVGKGAFFKSFAKALELTRTLIMIGEMNKIKTTALLTAMDQPLGYAVGNWLETLEAIQTLKSTGPEDVEKVTFTLGAEMLRLAGKVDTISEGEKVLRNCRDAGAGYEKFLAMVQGQHGDVSVIEHPESYPLSKYHLQIVSDKSGFVYSINAYEIGVLSMELGAGRKKMADTIDYTAGIVIYKKQGDAIKSGERIAEVAYSKAISDVYIKEKIQQAIQIEEIKLPQHKLILRYVNSAGDFDWLDN